MVATYLTKERKEEIRDQIKYSVRKKVYASGTGIDYVDAKQRLYDHITLICEKSFDGPDYYIALKHHKLISYVSFLKYEIGDDGMPFRNWSMNNNQIQLDFDPSFEIPSSNKPTNTLFEMLVADQTAVELMVDVWKLWDSLECEIREITKAYMDLKVHPFKTVNQMLKEYPEMKDYAKHLLPENEIEFEKSKAQKMLEAFEKS